MYDLIKKKWFSDFDIKKTVGRFMFRPTVLYIFFVCIIHNGSDHCQRHMKQHIIIFTIEYFIFIFLFCC